MGGNIGGRFTNMFPERVLSLDIFDSGGVGSPVPSKLIRRLSRGEANPLAVGSEEESDHMIQLVFSALPKIPKLKKRLDCRGPKT